MKCLVMSVKAGFGHHSTGQAVMDYLTQNGFECEMLDTFEYINPILGESISNGYLFSTKHFPEIYGKAYSSLDKHEESYDKHSLVAILSAMLRSSNQSPATLALISATACSYCSAFGADPCQEA